MGFSALLTDIEGTTSSISFVHEVLFPIAAEKLPAFLRENWGRGAITDEEKLLQKQGINDVEPAINTLLSYIENDVKDTALKSLQGRIWREAYESGEIKGHVYSDVKPALQKLKEEGKILAVFSSGSVEAQKLIFGYSEAGDLTPFFDAYFDTKTGSKKEALSYRRIAGQLGVEPEDVLFLSDVTAELDAASEAGMQTVLFLREGSQAPAGNSYKTMTSFSEI